MNLKEKALSGQKIFGTMIRIQRSPAIAYAAKNSGLDCHWKRTWTRKFSPGSRAEKKLHFQSAGSGCLRSHGSHAEHRRHGS